MGTRRAEGGRMLPGASAQHERTHLRDMLWTSSGRWLPSAHRPSENLAVMSSLAGVHITSSEFFRKPVVRMQTLLHYAMRMHATTKNNTVTPPDATFVKDCVTTSHQLQQRPACLPTEERRPYPRGPLNNSGFIHESSVVIRVRIRVRVRVRVRV